MPLLTRKLALRSQTSQTTYIIGAFAIESTVVLSSYSRLYPSFEATRPSVMAAYVGRSYSSTRRGSKGRDVSDLKEPMKALQISAVRVVSVNGNNGARRAGPTRVLLNNACLPPLHLRAEEWLRDVNAAFHLLHDVTSTADSGLMWSAFADKIRGELHANANVCMPSCISASEES